MQVLALLVLSAFSCKATSTQQMPNLLLILLLEHALCLKASLSYPRSLAELSCVDKEPAQKRQLIIFSLHLKFCLQTSNWDHGILFLFGFECSLIVLGPVFNYVAWFLQSCLINIQSFELKLQLTAWFDSMLIYSCLLGMHLVVNFSCFISTEAKL